MKDYRTMSPCERIAYYRAEIRRLSPPASLRETLLIEMFQQLIKDNTPLCLDERRFGKS